MNNVPNFPISSKNLNHLGLVAGTIRELGISERIDELLGSEKIQATKHVKVSECISAMILNGLGFANRSLYLVSSFFKNKPLDRLIGSHVKADYLNDDALGNSLDVIADMDPTTFFANIAFPIGMSRKYRKRFARLDSTTFSLEGAYDGFGDSPEESPEIVKVTYGHSKKHRPDLKQIVLSIVNSGEAGIPFWAEPLSGNASDKKSFHESIARVRAFQKEIGDSEPFNWAADSALYSKEHLLREDTDFYWVTRVPESIKEAKTLVSRPDTDFKWIELERGYKTTSHASNYGDVNQRWLLIFSQQAYEREIITLDKRIKKEFETIKKKLWHLSNEEFACVPDAEKKFLEVVKKFKFHSAKCKFKTEMKFSKPGRPKAGQKADKTIIHISATVIQNKESIASARATKGRFILATNDLDPTRLPNDQILKEYKDLQTVERGFRFLKDPWFMLDKVFLKTPRRIAALSIIMALCLMVYAIAEFEVRQALKTRDLTLPNQLNKKIQNPTLRWIFLMMDGITIVYMKEKSCVQAIILNIDALKEKIIRLFGEFTQQIYNITSEPLPETI